MATMLFGVKPTDPLTFGVFAVVMLVGAMVASFVRARRALRVDPVTARANHECFCLVSSLVCRLGMTRGS
jgi:putative ABC transport system permease protein